MFLHVRNEIAYWVHRLFDPMHFSCWNLTGKWKVREAHVSDTPVEKEAWLKRGTGVAVGPCQWTLTHEICRLSHVSLKITRIFFKTETVLRKLMGLPSILLVSVRTFLECVSRCAYLRAWRQAWKCFREHGFKPRLAQQKLSAGCVFIHSSVFGAVQTRVNGLFRPATNSCAGWYVALICYQKTFSLLSTPAWFLGVPWGAGSGAKKATRAYRAPELPSEVLDNPFLGQK